MVKKNRLRLEEEYIARSAACIRIKNLFKTKAVPRMLDYETNATIMHEHALPKEKRIKIYVSSEFDLKLKHRIYKEVDQVQISITFENAKELIKSWSRLLKKYEK